MNTVKNNDHTGSFEELARHLEAQRESVARLIEQHNSVLANLLNAAPAVHAEVPKGKTPVEQIPPQKPVEPPQPGTVVSLFEYAQRKSKVEADSSGNGSFQVFEENDPDGRALYGKRVDALLERYGADDALAINRKHMAGTIFLCQSSESLFYMREHSGVLFVVCFVGDDAVYPDAISELKNYAQGKDLQINFMVQESCIEVLQDSGFSTTPIGIWQRIDPIAEFTLAGQKMRRLRYLVSKYGKGEDRRTVEYKPGSDASTDQEICAVMDQWVDLKGTTPPYVPDVKESVLKGEIADDHRFFLTYRGNVMDNVIVFSRDNKNDGYLMDLEFYGESMPLGSTEFALTEIIRIFSEEGRRVVSLGLTMGTGLFEHENGSADVHKLFDQLKNADYVNGDANAQYKNKYRPVTIPMYLARPIDAGKSKLNDLLLLLGTG